MLFAVLLFDGFDDLDAVGPYEVLSLASRLGAPFRVIKVTRTEPLEVVSDHGTVVRADAVLDEKPDVLIVPGGGWAGGRDTGVRAQIAHGALSKRIAELHAQGTVVASVCTGAILVGSTGIGKGRRMITHHLAIEDLQKHGPEIVRERVVDDGDIISAGGITSGIDLGLHLIKRFSGDPSIAQKVADLLEYGWSKQN